MHTEMSSTAEIMAYWKNRVLPKLQINPDIDESAGKI